MNDMKIIEYSGPLFRANTNLHNKNDRLYYLAGRAKAGNLASINYKNAPTKYFTLKRNNVSAYTKKGTTYTKNWNTIKALKLVDILDLNTRQALEDKFITNRTFVSAITNAFPINGNIVRRISSSSEEDNQVLNKICSLGYDGYYMDVEGKNIGFHSEVGLCNKAFNKLKLQKNSEKKTVAQNITRKKIKSRFIMNNNNIPMGPLFKQ